MIKIQNNTNIEREKRNLDLDIMSLNSKISKMDKEL